ncbi:DUF2268 domain-containing protein [Alicyclobacillus fastidiosus]|uniref:DUF2268 domain-containing protein n=1 Tax=Alicyclobacillus fastidiosus TaxID=392011 RepID=A0ABY6ZGX6_9BACL|nr:DUF2268 domain-containing putative Zn-dependent protease [Alicyclobacillus fastidiosus]WAH41351.1 DUF2268 domain-containing protein [Alicyclobacillus fastidiosus]GMA62961.1 hypothetical protein GCM10025859_34010 [Alicyclobacillus fastidiosus]
MIKVFNYIAELIHVDDDTLANTLDGLSDELSKNQPYPFNFFVQASIRNAVKPFVSESTRDGRLQRLMNFDLKKVAEESCERVSTLLPSPIEDIEVHIFPAFDRGGGCTIAPGKVFVSVKIDDLAPVIIQRNFAHEYSHSVRMTQKPQAAEHRYGEEIPYTVRDYLVFEGLAMVCSDILYPAQISPIELSEADEDAWWNEANLDAVGGEAYVNYIGQRAYEIGSRIIRAYMQNQGVSVLEAHYVTDRELYWNSGYNKIR